ncbi:MAG TPA: hypothetical protein VF406_15895 [Thermodesulfobacteriota bacterium]
MLAGCRHICVAWAAIGLLALATGLAAEQGDLVRVGAFALLAFGTLRLAMASDDFEAIGARLAARPAEAPPKPAVPRAFWSRPAPYVLLPLIGFIVLVGRVLWRPPLGNDARYLITGIMAAALTVTVVYLVLLAVEGAHVAAAAPAQGALEDPAPPGPRVQGDEGLSAIGALDTARFTRDVLDVHGQGGAPRP